MRKMKDSGIAWIGEIPETWKVGRIKYNYYLKGRIGWQGLKSSEFIDEGPYLITGTDFEDNKVVWSRCYHISPERYAEAPEIHVKKGDLLVTKDGTVGKIAYIDSLPGEASLNSHLLIMRPLNPDYSNRFLKWVIQSDEFEQFMKLSQNGTIMSSLSQEKISQFSFAIPCVQEQDRLADGLEEHCAKTDAAMRTEQALIDQLTDYKQSLITETVTKGLHPEVARKDSGVEWIGEIPEKWSVAQIGLFAEIGAGNTPKKSNRDYWDGDIPWMSSGDVNFEYIYDTTEHLTELAVKETNIRILPVNTVMLGLIGQGKTKGKTAILKTKAACNQNLAYLIVDEDKLHYRYLFYCFRSMYVYLRGIIGDSQAGIYQYILKQLPIPLPAVSEQHEISEYLDAKCAAIDAKIKKRRKLMNELSEYKRSLIYEVVTGKREV